MKAWKKVAVVVFCGVIIMAAAPAAPSYAQGQGQEPAPAPAQVRCTGTDSFQTCRDMRGNKTITRRSGDMTVVSGTNCQRGERWSSTSRRLGNVIYHEGVTRTGQRWAVSERHYGTVVHYSGIGPDGAAINTTCNSYGCY